MRPTSLQTFALVLGLAAMGCSATDDTPAESGTGGNAGGAEAATGGAATGGSAGTGGTAASGGTSGSGGSGGTATGGMATGGLATGGSTTGGASTGGTPTGGASTGGTATGGTVTGGAGPGGTATGGASTGGAATGGAATGGAVTGGAATGGTATGGATDGGAATGGATTGGTGCVQPAANTNLFATISGHTQEETDAKVEAAWNQLYNPSNSNTVYYDGPGADESYVKDVANNDVRTEGMSYGMMTAVQLDHQTEFDRLWAWVKNHMAQGTTGQIAWQCTTSGQKLSSGGAPDGEEYFATALIFAHNRWGDTGRFDYASEAQWVLDLTRTLYFDSNYHIVQFVANSGNTDASYILPAFYQVWACFDTENAAFWEEAVTAGREFFHAAADSNGVIGDRQSFTGQTLQGAGSDAKRCVMNIMMDHNFFAADPWQTETYAPAFGSYMTTHSDGSTAQLSCNALLGFGLPESSGKSFVDRLWSTPIPTGQWRYYDGTLYMLALLHVSGKFQLWY